MPDMSGLDALTHMNSEGLGTKAVFLTANATDAHILALIEKGARALLLKDTAIGEVALCIRKVAGGGRHFPNDIVAAAIERETGRRSVGEQFERVLSAASARSCYWWRRAAEQGSGAASEPVRGHGANPCAQHLSEDRHRKPRRIGRIDAHAPGPAEVLKC